MFEKKYLLYIYIADDLPTRERIYGIVVAP